MTPELLEVKAFWTRLCMNYGEWYVAAVDTRLLTR